MADEMLQATQLVEAQPDLSPGLLGSALELC